MFSQSCVLLDPSPWQPRLTMRRQGRRRSLSCTQYTFTAGCLAVEHAASRQLVGCGSKSARSVWTSISTFLLLLEQVSLLSTMSSTDGECCTTCELVAPPRIDTVSPDQSDHDASGNLISPFYGYLPTQNVCFIFVSLFGISLGKSLCRRSPSYWHQSTV